MSLLFVINRFLPSTEEAEMYKNYKEDPSTLVPEDQFMMKVINNISATLELLAMFLDNRVQGKMCNEDQATGN